MLKLLEEDLRAVELYRDFLPKRIFDAHAHLYAEGTVPELYDPKGLFCLREIDADTYKDAVLPFFPGVEKIELMAMPMPTRSMNDNPELRERANLHVMGMAPRAARPVIMLAEQLMALRYAAMLLELDSSDVEKIFYKNAERVFSKNT